MWIKSVLQLAFFYIKSQQEKCQSECELTVVMVLGFGWVLVPPFGPFWDRYQLIPTISLLCGQFLLFLPKLHIREVVLDMWIKLFCILFSFHVVWYVRACAWVCPGHARPGFFIWEDFKLHDPSILFIYLFLVICTDLFISWKICRHPRIWGCKRNNKIVSRTLPWKSLITS